jgi:1-acyl-sn-glycerol-3-phosphate acyltransferase
MQAVERETARGDPAAGPDPLGLPTCRNIVWFTSQMVLRLVFTTWLQYRARGIEKIPAEGGGLLLINHQSFLDPLLVGLPLTRPVSYLARNSLFRVPVIGWILRHTYVLPINREAASSTTIREAVRRMNEGFLVGIFPEGTRSDDGSIGALKPGFVALIRRTRLPVVPVGIAGAGDALPRHSWFLRPTRVRVVFGEPISPDEIRASLRHGQEGRLLALAQRAITHCQQEAETWRRR